MMYFAQAADACTASNEWAQAFGIGFIVFGFAAIIWAANR